MSLDPATPLGDARAWLRERMEAGAACPCCDQFAKVYKRTITASMAHALVLIYRYYRDRREGWLHVPSYLGEMAKVGAAVRGGDWAKLRFWGLLAAGDFEKREDGSDRVGYYTITDRGRRFVEGSLAVPRYIYLYNQILSGWDAKESISIRQALGRGFSYQELMAAR